MEEEGGNFLQQFYSVFGVTLVRKLDSDDFES